MRLALPWVLVCLGMSAGCAHTPSHDDEAPPLVFEAVVAKPARYRTVPSLLASGSGVFTPKGLETIVAGAKGPVTILDLRREPHGYVNEEPVTWNRDRGASLDVPYDDVLARETELLLNLRGEETLDRTPAPNDQPGAAPPPAVLPKVEVRSVRSERDVVEASGLRYRRLLVAESYPPDDGDVDRFLKIVKALPPNAWLHFHCRDGGSRTLDFLILYDMIRNAARVSSYAEIVARQEKAATDATSNGSAAVEAGRYAVDRERFFQRFHEYARNFPNGGGPGWRAWLSGSP